MGISFIGFRVECFLLALGLLLTWAEKPFMSPFIVKGDLSFGGGLLRFNA